MTMHYVDRVAARNMESILEHHLAQLERELKEDPDNEELQEAVESVRRQLKEAPWL